MTDIKLINSFYRDYKKIYSLLQDEVNCTSYSILRLIDRIIIFVFIKENLFNNEQLMDFKKNVKDNNAYGYILEFYNNKSHIYNDQIRNILELFNNDKLEDLKIKDELIQKVLIILNKHKWNIRKVNNDKNITPDILGSVFEKYINQKEMGAYYTEEDTIKYINQNSIMYSIFNKINDKKKLLIIINNIINKNIVSIEGLIKNNYNLLKLMKDIICTTNDNKIIKELTYIIKNLKIADITCGTGAFLISVIEILQELNICLENNTCILRKRKKYEILIDIIEQNIYGVDIMEDAIEIAKVRLYLKVIEECINNNIKVHKRIKFNLKVGNTLYGMCIEDTLIQDNFINGIEPQKFNWNEEFSEVLQAGGFDCIIGNPPYVEYKEVKDKYQLQDYETIKCGNIYAFTIERAIQLLKTDGVLGVIVPISIVATKRMEPLRSFIQKNCVNIFYSNFADRPDTLFNGVHQKVTIVLAQKCISEELNIYTSRYYHWYKEEREGLFSSVKYIENILDTNETIYKINNEIDKSIINKINKINKSIIYMIDSNGKYTSYLSTRLTFWVKCFNSEKKSKEFKQYKFNTEEEKYIFTAIMNSSLYYYFWELISDEWHITSKELFMFKFDIDLLQNNLKRRLVYLSKQLENSLENNRRFIGTKQTQYEYRHKKSKILIDEIDKVLQEYYMLTDEEYSFIIDYNLKYRMNDEYENYLNTRIQKI